MNKIFFRKALILPLGILCLGTQNSYASDRSVEVFPLTIVERESPLIKAMFLTGPVTPQKPKVKKSKNNIDITKEYLLPMPLNTADKSLFAKRSKKEKTSDLSMKPAHDNPPIPRKRPKIFTASKSFIAALHKKQRQPPIPLKKKRAFVEDSGFAFPLLDAAEILAQIDPAAGALKDIKGQDKISRPENSKIPKPADNKPIDNMISIDFLSTKNEINKALAPHMAQKILARAQVQSNERIQIHSYARAQNNSGKSGARRLSLERALQIRDFLVDNNIQPNRITLRALGDKIPMKQVDQVDVIFIGLAG